MRAVRWLSWIIGGFVLLMIAGVAAVWIFMPVDTLRARAVREAEAATGYDVELGDLHLGLSRSGLSLVANDVRLSNPELDAESGAEFFRLERLDVGVALWPLVRKQVDVTRLVLHHPEIALRRDAQGRLNTEVKQPAAPPADTTGTAPRAGGTAARGAPAGVLLAIPEARIENGRLTLVDVAGGSQFDIADLDGALRVGLESQVVNLAGQIRAGGLAAEVGGQPPTRYGPYDTQLAFDLAYRSDASDLTVRSASLSLAAIDLTVAGAVHAIDTAPTLDLELHTGVFEPARVMSLVPRGVPAGLAMAGTAELTASVRGPAVKPSVEGVLRLRDVAVTPPGYDEATLTALNGEIRFSEQSAALPGLRGRLPGGEFTLSATVESFAQPRVTGQLELDAELVPLAALAPLPPGLELHGGKAGVALGWRMRAPDWTGSLDLDGRIDLEDVHVTVPELATAVTIERCPVRLHGQSATVPALAVRAGRSDLAGRIDVKGLTAPRVGFTLTSTRLDLDELLPAPPAAPAEGDQRAQPETGPADGAALPPLPLLDGTLAARRLVYRGLTATDVELHASTDETGLHVTDVTGRLLGGQLAGDVDITPSAGTMRYRSTLHADSLQANELLTAMTPIDNVVHGTLFANIDLSGLSAPELNPLDFITANGDTRLTNGYLEASGGLGTILKRLNLIDGDRFSYDRFVSKIEVRDGRVLLDNGKMLSGKQGEYHLGGSVGFDGSLAVDVDALIPARYLPADVTKNAQVVELLSDERGRVPLGFSIGGDLSSPKVEIDLGALEKEVQAKLADRAKKELEKKAGEGVNGLLKNLLKKGGK